MRTHTDIAIKIENLTRSFPSSRGEIYPVEDLSLTLNAGEITALLGRSGCGKTTLMRLIAGLETPTQGQVSFLSKDTGKPVSPKIAIVFQEPRLLPWLNVLDNVALALMADIKDKSQRHEKAKRALEWVELSESQEKYPDQLSGGMAQRVGIARALVTEPDVLLMDEPFGALDALTRAELQLGLVELLSRRPCTVFMITHDVREAALLADRILIQAHGKIVRDEPILFSRPRSLANTQLASLEESVLESLIFSKKKMTTQM